MTLPKGFLFSQSSLQDYVDCQRRFQLRYILRQAWPAVEVEPFIDYEQMMDQGSRFHQIVHQHLVGVPAPQIEKTITNDELLEMWWKNYIKSTKDGELASIWLQGVRRYEEVTLTVPVNEFRLIAKYDLFIVNPDGKLVIFDWKTSRKHPKRKWLADRLQTHVYPFVLTRAAPAVIGADPVEPGQVEMIYWFTNQPDQPEHFTYSQSAYSSDLDFLSSLITKISQKTDVIFPLTPDEKRCLFCTYRSLCNRGVQPGELNELEEWQQSAPASEDVTIDVDQIGEIEF